jgi:hypothetical protein
MEWIRLIWLRIGSSGGLLWTWYWTFGFHKMLGSSCVAAQLAAPQEGLSSVSKQASYVLQNEKSKHWYVEMFSPNINLEPTNGFSQHVIYTSHRRRAPSFVRLLISYQEYHFGDWHNETGASVLPLHAELYRVFRAEVHWTLTHTDHKDTGQSTTEASITLDGVTLTDSLLRWSPNEFFSLCREIPVSADKMFWTSNKPA